MQDNEITTIKVTTCFNNGQSADASFEVPADEHFELVFCNNLMPTYPTTLYVVTRKKAGGRQILNAVEILKNIVEISKTEQT